MSLLRLAACGTLAGAAGTIAMDVVWYIRYRRAGGTQSFPQWEFASPPASWDEASAPAKVGKLVYETLTHNTLGPEHAGLATNLTHWAYGCQWGVVAAFALQTAKSVKPLQAPLFGALVWLASYVSLPIAGFYKPIWEYDAKTLWKDLSAHLIYGAATIAAFKLLRVSSESKPAGVSALRR